MVWKYFDDEITTDETTGKKDTAAKDISKNDEKISTLMQNSLSWTMLKYRLFNSVQYDWTCF